MDSAPHSTDIHRREFLKSTGLVALSAAVSPEAADVDETKAELEIHLTGEGQQDRRITINGQEARTIPTTAMGEQVIRIELADASHE